VVPVNPEGEPQFPDENDFFEALLASNNQLGQAQESNSNSQIGLAQLIPLGLEAEPVEAQFMEAEANKLRQKFFSSGNPSSLHITLPMQWKDFFTVLLLSPGNFSWAMNLLSSKVISFLTNDDSNYVQLDIPASCPDFNITCLPAVDEEGHVVNVGTSRVVPVKKRHPKRSTAIVESEVRRSPRLKENAMGFKIRSCSDKSCLACGIVPPILQRETIKKIAIDFCNIDESDLNTNLSQFKKRKTHPVARARLAPPPQEPAQVLKEGQGPVGEAPNLQEHPIQEDEGAARSSA
jgi:hypothetical protein